MKKKGVIKVAMCNSRSRIKAMKLVVSIPGVTSVEMQGSGQDEIVVTGEGIDFACLTMLIKKKVGCAELMSIAPVPEKKEGDKKPDPVVIPICYGPSHCHCCYVSGDSRRGYIRDSFLFCCS